MVGLSLELGIRKHARFRKACSQHQPVAMLSVSMANLLESQAVCWFAEQLALEYRDFTRWHRAVGS